MKILVLTLGVALVCGLQALDNNKGDDTSMLVGDWYTVALAANNISKIKKGGSLRMYVKNIHENGDMIHGNFLKEENEKCVKFSVTGQVVDGVIKVPYDGINECYIQSVESDYAMFFLYNYKGKEVTSWAELYGRTPDLSDEIKKKFEKMCENHGIRKDEILDLTKDDRCEELR